MKLHPTFPTTDPNSQVKKLSSIPLNTELKKLHTISPNTGHYPQLKKLPTTFPNRQLKKQLTSSPNTDPFPHLCPISLFLFLPHPPLEVTLPLIKFTPSSYSLPPLHNQCTLLVLYPKKARVPSIEQAILMIPPKKHQFVGHLITARMMLPSSNRPYLPPTQQLFLFLPPYQLAPPLLSLHPLLMMAALLDSLYVTVQ